MTRFGFGRLRLWRLLPPPPAPAPSSVPLLALAGAIVVILVVLTHLDRPTRCPLLNPALSVAPVAMTGDDDVSEVAQRERHQPEQPADCWPCLRQTEQNANYRA